MCLTETHLGGGEEGASLTVSLINSKNYFYVLTSHPLRIYIFDSLCMGIEIHIKHFCVCKEGQ